MANIKFILGITLVHVLFRNASPVTDKIVCYYRWWTKNVDDIDVNICTHVNYAFFELNENGTFRQFGTDDELRRFTGLKSKNSNLKLMISIAAGKRGSTLFSNIANDPVKRTVMAHHVQWYIEKFGFDGVDIDWEYPAKLGGQPSDKGGFVSMLQEIRRIIGNGQIVTTAVSARPDDSSYDVPEISKIVDYINVMTYDFHSGSSDKKTGENSPLYAALSDSTWEKKYANCNVSIHNWIEAGAHRSKIILGVPFYGRSFTLADPDNHKINSRTTEPGIIGTATYAKICQLKDGWTDVYDDRQRVPYKYKGNQWIGYDNPRSIGEKVQFAKDMRLGGVMVWALDQDDRYGLCGEKFPMINSIKNSLSR